MSSSEVVAPAAAQAAAPSAAQARIIAAALELFAQHGVGGTSLQMIADTIGVTKAAVYHQYKTKDEIIVAAATAELARLEARIAAAEAAASTSPARGREVMVAGMIDLAIERRRLIGTLLNDPVIGRVFASREPFHQVMGRLARVLVGADAGPEARIQTAVLSAAISGAVVHPLVADLDDTALRAQLIHLAHGILNN